MSRVPTSPHISHLSMNFMEYMMHGQTEEDLKREEEKQKKIERDGEQEQKQKGLKNTTWSVRKQEGGASE